MNGRIAALGQAVRDGVPLDRARAAALIDAAREDPWDLLYWAHRVRTDRFGRAVKLCSIVPGKLGGCREDCRWCAQSCARGQAAMPARRTSVEEIVAASERAAGDGAAALGIVNSGRRPTPRDLRDVLGGVAKIRAARGEHIDVCVSLGELSPDQARQLAAGGVRRVNHNLETSRAFYPRVVTTHSYEDRLRCLQAVRQAGMCICCGGIFGLGETWDDRIDLALTLRDQVRPDVVPLNFLHPIPGTALEHQPPMPPMEILTVVALYRLMLPGVDLKIAGGRESNLRDMQSWMFYAGATSCLIGNYLTTPGRPAADDLQMIRDLELTVVSELPPPASAAT